ncbi:MULTISPECIES: ISAzo13-like element transposase-related protein [unclassified Microcoleus]|uniref:ISAzo13-like element transposase-related protein n=1 Tax=unclassified Microcoleus TaxID=2642155 RepID=UPI00403FBB85
MIKGDRCGSNNSNYHSFKSDLQKLVNELYLEIIIAHYLPYTSKYNPIEHRLFAHVTRACLRYNTRLRSAIWSGKTII